jgi:hypothetical protein
MLPMTVVRRGQLTVDSYSPPSPPTPTLRVRGSVSEREAKATSLPSPPTPLLPCLPMKNEIKVFISTI